MNIEKFARDYIFHKDTNVGNFAIDVLDFVGEFERIAETLETDPDPLSMIFKIREMQREIDRQRKTIAELRKKNGKES